MEIGESRSARIDSRKPWNETGIHLTAGEQYHLRAVGAWIDWKKSCDANGYDSINRVQQFSERLRRVPGERWFTLIGSIGRDGRELFPIGADRAYSPRTSGNLFCFANDVRIAYWNNHGTIMLTVMRVG